jgi:exonuclease SbcD
VAEAAARRVDALLVPGDLFDGEEADVETVNRAVECARAPGCPPVFIAPGNHDCYSRASTYYDNAKLAARHQPVWPEHVHIFTSPQFAAAELPGRPAVRIWGRCVDANVESDDRVLVRAPRPEPGLVHVLLLHGSRDGFLAGGKRLTAPFSDAELLAAGPGA